MPGKSRSSHDVRVTVEIARSHSHEHAVSADEGHAELNVHDRCFVDGLQRFVREHEVLVTVFDLSLDRFTIFRKGLPRQLSARREKLGELSADFF